MLKALSRAATQLREKLGESLSLIRRFDKPLEATTSKLDAFQAYALGYDLSASGRLRELIPVNERRTPRAREGDKRVLADPDRR